MEGVATARFNLIEVFDPPEDEPGGVSGVRPASLRIPGGDS